MDNALGPASSTECERTAARNSIWAGRLRLFVLWILVLVPLLWGISRAFDGVAYFVPQG